MSTVAAHRPRLLTAAAGLALLAALTVALLPGRPEAPAIALAAAGLGASLILTAPAALALVRRHRGLLLLAGLAVLVTAWVVTGLQRASGTWPSAGRWPEGIPFPFAVYPYRFQLSPGSTGWPWRIGRVSLLPAMLMALSAGGGLVLIADAVRIDLGLTGTPRAPWRTLMAARTRNGRIAWRAIPGVALIGVATALAIGLAARYVAGRDPVLETLVMLSIGGWAALLIAAPVAVGVAMRVDLDKAGRAREEERRRFAAHLHDSVLQTLALVQRQAHDPAAVIRLARRQEHALRAWMAGEAELTSDTVAAAVRDAVAEAEDEHDITVELTAIGDRALDARGEALVAAAREALRNAARHAPGAPVFVFLDITGERAELFVRDEGPGFDPDAVAAERRGLRDAVIGRMAVAGGRATVESAVGQGTEVALHIPYNGRSR